MRCKDRLTLLALLACLSLISTGRAAAPQDNQLTGAERDAGWRLLFNGRNLDGWMTSDGKPSRRKVRDGTINPHRCGAYMMVHKQMWENFHLKLDFRISPRCNSGIFFRTWTLKRMPGRDVGFNGLEIAIDDTKTAGYHDTGALYDLIKPTRNAMKPTGQWNHLELTCQGQSIRVVLNGTRVLDGDLGQFTKPNLRPDGSRHKFPFAYSAHPRRGYIGLQDHGADCWFKNIKLRDLKKPRQ